MHEVRRCWQAGLPHTFDTSTSLPTLPHSHSPISHHLNHNPPILPLQPLHPHHLHHRPLMRPQHPGVHPETRLHHPLMLLLHIPPNTLPHLQFMLLHPQLPLDNHTISLDQVHRAPPLCPSPVEHAFDVLEAEVVLSRLSTRLDPGVGELEVEVEAWIGGWLTSEVGTVPSSSTGAWPPTSKM